MAVNPKNQIRNNLVRSKNQSERKSASRISYPYIYGEYAAKFLQSMVR